MRNVEKAYVVSCGSVYPALWRCAPLKGVEGALRSCALVKEQSCVSLNIIAFLFDCCPLCSLSVVGCGFAPSLLGRRVEMLQQP